MLKGFEGINNLADTNFLNMTNQLYNISYKEIIKYNSNINKPLDLEPIIETSLEGKNGFKILPIISNGETGNKVYFLNSKNDSLEYELPLAKFHVN